MNVFQFQILSLKKFRFKNMRVELLFIYIQNENVTDSTINYFRQCSINCFLNSQVPNFLTTNVEEKRFCRWFPNTYIQKVFCSKYRLFYTSKQRRSFRLSNLEKV